MTVTAPFPDALKTSKEISVVNRRLHELALFLRLPRGFECNGDVTTVILNQHERGRSLWRLEPQPATTCC